MNRMACGMSLAAILWGSAGWAQPTGNPGGAAPETPGLDSGTPAVDYPNTQDKLFVRQAAIGGQAEVDLGKLAQSKGRSDAVKEFARRMVTDHGKSNDRLMQVAKAEKVQLPKDPDPDQKAARAELEKAAGADFDAAYLRLQIHDHQKTAQLLEWEIGSGQSDPMKKYAADTLPTVLEHLQMAQMDLAQLTMTH